MFSTPSGKRSVSARFRLLQADPGQPFRHADGHYCLATLKARAAHRRITGHGVDHSLRMVITDDQHRELLVLDQRSQERPVWQQGSMRSCHSLCPPVRKPPNQRELSNARSRERPATA